MHLLSELKTGERLDKPDNKTCHDDMLDMHHTQLVMQNLASYQFNYTVLPLLLSYEKSIFHVFHLRHYCEKE